MPIVRQFKGLVPALDPRQVTEKLVLDGRNFLVDAQGPFSAFGSDLIAFEKIPNSQFSKTFRVAGEIFLFTSTRVLKYDVTADVFIPIFFFDAPLLLSYPWTRAIVGGVHYFVKRGSAIISYNPLTKKWATVTANVPVNPYFVIQSGGRLIIMGESVVGWSAIDNGTDLATDVEKGVGQQSLAIAGGGDPLALLPTSDGFIAYTSAGSMKAEYVQSLSPFRVFPLTGNDDHIPLSQWNIIELGKNEHVMLTKTGFYITSGKLPEVYQPLMSEYFRRNVLPGFDLSNPSIFKLTYHPDKEWFIVSISESEQSFQFSKAFVLYIPRDEWGSFNRSHLGFGELSLAEGPFIGFNFGYFSIEGFLNKFSDFPRVEQHPNVGGKLPGNMYHFHTQYEIPAYYKDGIAYMPTVAQLTTIDEASFLTSGLYVYENGDSHVSPINPDTTEDATVVGAVYLMPSSMSMGAGLVQDTWKTLTRQYGSVDAWVNLGLWAGKTEADRGDEVTLVTEVVIGMLEAPSGQESADWLIFAPDTEEDWLNDNLPDEDWGAGVFSGTVYEAQIIGSLDGENVFQDQQEVLEERVDIVDTVNDETTGKVKYFTCYNNGFYHILKITAQEVDQSFHVKTVDIPLIGAGRL